MRAADRLGAGTAFAAARSPRNLAKAQAQGDIPQYDLVTLPLDDVVPTPLNPRRNFGSSDELLTLGRGLAQTQLQPCVAVPATAYLRLWPEHADQIGSAGQVLINGERRWRAAKEAGLEKLDFTLRSDLTVVHEGDTQAARARLLDAVLKENIDRKNFDPIEEARGVAALVAAYGDGVRAGQQLNRGKAWVSQRLTLLALPESLQDEVGAGRISIDDGRWMGARAKKSPGLTGEELLQLLQEHQEAQRHPVRTKAPASSGGFTAGNPPERTGLSGIPDPMSAMTVIGRSEPESPTNRAPTLPPRLESGFTAVNRAEPGTSMPTEQPTPTEPPAVVRPRSAAELTAPAPEQPVDGSSNAARNDLGEDFTLAMATPEQIVDALVSELSPESLARVADLLLRRMPTRSRV